MDRVPSFDKIGVTPVPDWQNAAPSAGIPGSIFNVEAINALQREVVNAIAGSGLTPDATNLSQLLAAIQRITAAQVQQALPAIPTYSAVEGVKDVNGVFSLDVSDLPQATPVAADRIPFFRASAGHHAQDTLADFTTAIMALIAVQQVSTGVPKLSFITASQSWTPTGKGLGVALLVGGGGAGGGASGNAVGGGGGSGGATILSIPNLSTLGTVALVIGAPGVGNASADGNSGGTTAFGNLATALGGYGGPNGPSDSDGRPGGAGAPQGSGGATFGGNPGAGVSNSPNGVGGGNGGASILGGAGLGANAGSPGQGYDGGNAQGPGSGGGGSDCYSGPAVKGGSGGGGIIIIMEYA